MKLNAVNLKMLLSISHCDLQCCSLQCHSSTAAKEMGAAKYEY
jgi:hypothetical protein